jgi:hypothetical protein
MQLSIGFPELSIGRVEDLTNLCAVLFVSEMDVRQVHVVAILS